MTFSWPCRSSDVMLSVSYSCAVLDRAALAGRAAGADGQRLAVQPQLVGAQQLGRIGAAARHAVRHRVGGDVKQVLALGVRHEAAAQQHQVLRGVLRPDRHGPARPRALGEGRREVERRGPASLRAGGIDQLHRHADRGAGRQREAGVLRGERPQRDAVGARAVDPRRRRAGKLAQQRAGAGREPHAEGGLRSARRRHSPAQHDVVRGDGQRLLRLVVDVQPRRSRRGPRGGGEKRQQRHHRRGASSTVVCGERQAQPGCGSK